jgi:hypothetical protein
VVKSALRVTPKYVMAMPPPANPATAGFAARLGLV